MRTVLFATCYIGQPEHLERYRNYLKFYQPKLSKLGAFKIFLIDDGSPMEYLAKLGVKIIEVDKINTKEYPDLSEQVYIFRFPDNLGRPCRTMFPGWWRSFSFISVLAFVYGLDKVIHIESDTFVLTDKMFDSIKNNNSRWTVPFSRQDRYPESCIQVIPKTSKINWYYPERPKDNFKQIFQYFAKGNEFWFKNNYADFQYIPEMILPFDEVTHEFKGDRYGEDWCKKIPENIDYIANVSDVSPNPRQHHNILEKKSRIDVLLDLKHAEGVDITGFHSGDMGDVIYCIPTIKSLGITKLYLNPEPWYMTKMDRKAISILKPLLESEGIECIIPEATDILKIDYILDAFRYTGQDMYWQHLAISQAKGVNIDLPDFTKPWLTNIKPKYIAPVVINRSARYHGCFMDWKELLGDISSKIIFVGLKDEYDAFIKETGMDNIEFYTTSNLMELAEVIAGSHVFIGNQSSPFAIAEGLKVCRIQETCEWDANCKPLSNNSIAIDSAGMLQFAKLFLKQALTGEEVLA